MKLLISLITIMKLTFRKQTLIGQFSTQEGVHEEDGIAVRVRPVVAAKTGGRER